MFIALWFVGAAINMWVGVSRAGYSMAEEAPFFLTSGDQFRPAAPPAFNSPAFLAGLAEVRTLSDTRTAAQLAEARFWATRGPLFLLDDYVTRAGLSRMYIGIHYRFDITAG